jgi:hypothetical protein
LPGIVENERAHPASGLLCYAVSRDDGVTFTRPKLGLYKFAGSTANNILFDGNAFKDQGFTIPEGGVSVFKDANPDCPADAVYKAVAIARKPGDRRHSGLAMLKSADGLRWSVVDKKLAITDGAFDSQNLAFYDPVRKEYRVYYRDNHRGVRLIKTATSPDFAHWANSQDLTYGDAPMQALYTSQVQPYWRAPHLLVGFPLRYMDRGWSNAMESLPGLEQRQARAKLSKRYGTVLTDALFMSSRDGVQFHRWDEAFIRPSGGSANWVYGDNSVAWGLVDSPAAIAGGHREISLYVTEGYWVGQSLNLRRYGLRMDGFVSINATRRGGEAITRPISLVGNRLQLNFATSAAGSVRVELQKDDGTPWPGFELKNCLPMFGDHLNHTVSWTQGTDTTPLRGHQIRIRFVINDADLYAFGI